MSDSAKDAKDASIRKRQAEYVAPVMRQACDYCHAHRTKCDKGTPCGMCVKKDKVCIYSAAKKRPVKLSLTAARPDVAEMWDYLKNNEVVTPATVSFGSRLPAHWICPKTSCSEGCVHRFEKSVNSMTGKDTDANGCPFCAHKQVCEHESLAALRPDVAAMLHPTKNVGVDPKTLSVYSNKTFEFICHKTHPECTCDQEHSWPAMLEAITKENCTTCPFCSGRNTCRCRSFGARHPEIAAQLDPAHEHPDPFTLSEYSHKRLWFLCPQHGAWDADVASRVYYQSGCPDCKRTILEESGGEVLTELGFTFTTQFKFRKGVTFRYDMMVHANKRYETPNWLLELNGRQHFQPSSFGSSAPGAARRNYVYQVKEDLSKDFLASEKGMHFLRIPYTRGKTEGRRTCYIENEILSFVRKMRRHTGGVPLHVRADPSLYEARDRRNAADEDLLALVNGDYTWLKVD